MTVTRDVMVNQVSEELGMGKQTINAVINALFNTMREHLTDGNRIEVRGFGSFTVKEMKPKPRARNPRTGEKIQVPPRRKVHFKPGKLIKEAIRAQRAK